MTTARCIHLPSIGGQWVPFQLQRSTPPHAVDWHHFLRHPAHWFSFCWLFLVFWRVLLCWLCCFLPLFRWRVQHNMRNLHVCHTLNTWQDTSCKTHFSCLDFAGWPCPQLPCACATLHLLLLLLSVSSQLAEPLEQAELECHLVQTPMSLYRCKHHWCTVQTAGLQRRVEPWRVGGGLEIFICHANNPANHCFQHTLYFFQITDLHNICHTTVDNYEQSFYFQLHRENILHKTKQIHKQLKQLIVSSPFLNLKILQWHWKSNLFRNYFFQICRWHFGWRSRWRSFLCAASSQPIPLQFQCLQFYLAHMCCAFPSFLYFFKNYPFLSLLSASFNNNSHLLCSDAEPTGALHRCNAEKCSAQNAVEKRTGFQYWATQKRDAERKKNSPQDFGAGKGRHQLTKSLTVDLENPRKRWFSGPELKKKSMLSYWDLREGPRIRESRGLSDSRVENLEPREFSDENRMAVFHSVPTSRHLQKIAPWSSRWFEEILISLTLISLTLISVTFCQKFLLFHSIFITWELIQYTCKWNKFNQMELSHIVSQHYPHTTKRITQYPFSNFC